jgi:hypothetical protein
MSRPTRSPEDRFWDKVWQGDGCWLWTGRPNRQGYGVLREGPSGSRTLRAHRFSYELLVGPILEGLVIDHLCSNTMCVNPDHLDSVTQAENVRRGRTGQAFGAMQRARTHCPQGHEYSNENTYLWNTYRACRMCRKEADIRHKSKKKVLLSCS